MPWPDNVRSCTQIVPAKTHQLSPGPRSLFIEMCWQLSLSYAQWSHIAYRRDWATDLDYPHWDIAWELTTRSN